MTKTGQDIAYARQQLMDGNLVAIPTETVYGLAANALDVDAVVKIFEVKNRPTFDPLIVHAVSIEQIQSFVADLPAEAKRLAEAFWPGPLTLVLNKKDIIPDLVTSGLKTVGVRIPRHPLTLELLQTLDFPLAAPSANLFGYVSPTTAYHVYSQLGQQIGYTLDGGACKIGIESTIVSFADGVEVLRVGGCKLEDIKSIVGRVKVRTHSTSNPAAPGMMDSHYAPRTPLVMGDIKKLLKIHEKEHVGILSFSDAYIKDDTKRQFVLSEKKDLEEAATRLFIGLRELDALNLQLILAEPVPDVGLGKAINDRLRRAEMKRN